MKIYVSILVLFLVSSCKQKENKTITNTNSKTVVLTKQNEVNKEDNDTLYLNFTDEKGEVTFESELDAIHSKKYVKFENHDIGELKAKITIPKGGGNIRFNQIIFPDNSSNGPFGMDLDIDLNQKGKHILVIGHSQMADGLYEGKFKVQLQRNVKD